MKTNPTAFISNGIEADKVMLNKEKMVFLLGEDDVLGLPSYPCNIVRSDNAYFPNLAAYVFQNDSPYIGAFNLAIKKFVQDGIMQRILMQEEKAMRLKKCSNDNEFKPLGYENIFTIFISCCIGIVVSIAYCCIEGAYYKLCNVMKQKLHISSEQT